MSYRYIEPAYDVVDLSASTALDALATYGRPVTVRAREDGDLVGVTAQGIARTIAVVADEEIPVLWRSIAVTNAVALRVYIWGRR